MNETAEVKATNLFVAPNKDFTRQITVYSNNVQTESRNNMMVLPVPHPESIKFIDLTEYKDIFKDLEKSFDVQYRSLGSNSKGALKVEKVGSYNATIVPTFGQLYQIDKNVFGTINPELKKVLGKYYNSMGFIVCKLNPSSDFVNYHPFAYSHKINKVLFVPTRHLHNGHEEETSHWDHCIYSFGTGKECGNCETTTDYIRLKLEKIPFDFGPKNINKLRLDGYYTNMDVEFAIAPVSTIPVKN